MRINSLKRNGIPNCRRNIKKKTQLVLRLKIYLLKKQIDFINCFKMAEENMVFHFMNEDYFKQMQEIYKGKAMLKIALYRS